MIAVSERDMPGIELKNWKSNLENWKNQNLIQLKLELGVAR